MTGHKFRHSPNKSSSGMTEKDKALNDANNVSLPSAQREAAMDRYRELKKRDK